MFKKPGRPQLNIVVGPTWPDPDEKDGPGIGTKKVQVGTSTRSWAVSELHYFRKNMTRHDTKLDNIARYM